MSALPNRKFWMVHGVGQGAPTARHDSAKAAAAEARRLAARVPGVTFVVLEAIGAVIKADVQAVSFGGEGDWLLDEIPF